MLKLKSSLCTRSSCLVALSILAGCSSVSLPSVSGLWPFGDGVQGREPGPPPNATGYRCEGNRGFYVRTLPSGSVWVILAEREFRLDKQGEAGRFSNGVAVLETTGGDASLTDGPGQAYTGCKIEGAVPAKG